jgi:hypothetical protein
MELKNIEARETSNEDILTSIYEKMSVKPIEDYLSKLIGKDIALKKELNTSTASILLWSGENVADKMGFLSIRFANASIFTFRSTTFVKPKLYVLDYLDQLENDWDPRKFKTRYEEAYTMFQLALNCTFKDFGHTQFNLIQAKYDFINDAWSFKED